MQSVLVAAAFEILKILLVADNQSEWKKYIAFLLLLAGNNICEKIRKRTSEASESEVEH